MRSGLDEVKSFRILVSAFRSLRWNNWEIVASDGSLNSGRVLVGESSVDRSGVSKRRLDGVKRAAVGFRSGLGSGFFCSGSTFSFCSSTVSVGSDGSTSSCVSGLADFSSCGSGFDRVVRLLGDSARLVVFLFAMTRNTKNQYLRFSGCTCSKKTATPLHHKHIQVKVDHHASVSTPASVLNFITTPYDAETVAISASSRLRKEVWIGSSRCTMSLYSS
ncbi:hypothetical protein OGAPHI_001059 [Ogataea philodendri]|uniref:Uncharacterized protein n=1 Tax=Ogataea philodendri TaxID=1378263 RepID=A0A9P8PFZ6_9ASCO|nr:uncharacterized protein OGAPHI_001059 [Ogataea philodendri]KAH3670544.1 hypothetical protein OGAPHI_001059 [Ogataea philodendri]